jgi:hypothetical protein
VGQAAGATRRTSSVRQRLPYAGMVIGLWAAVTPYVLLGPDLNAAGSREVIDHVVPGALLLVLSTALLLRSRSAGDNVFPLVAGLGVLLAGFWMTATHLPLVGDARRGAVRDAVAAWHIVPGLVVMVLGAVWAATWWSPAGDQPGVAASGTTKSGQAR